MTRKDFDQMMAHHGDSAIWSDSAYRIANMAAEWVRKNEFERLKRENTILRSELKERLVSEWMAVYEMSEEKAEENAEQYIVHMVAHNEGAE